MVKLDLDGYMVKLDLDGYMVKLDLDGYMRNAPFLFYKNYITQTCDC